MEFAMGFEHGFKISVDLLAEKMTPTKVIFNNPATVVFWQDGTKTVVKVQNNETFDKEKGFAMAFMKKFFGNTGCYNEIVKCFCEDGDA